MLVVVANEATLRDKRNRSYVVTNKYDTAKREVKLNESLCIYYTVNHNQVQWGD